MAAKLLIKLCATVTLAGVFQKITAVLPEIYPTLQPKEYYDKIVKIVNNGENHWQAGHNFEMEKLAVYYKMFSGSSNEVETGDGLETIIEGKTKDNDEDYEDYDDDDINDNYDDDDRHDDEEEEDDARNGVDVAGNTIPYGESEDIVQCPHRQNINNVKEMTSGGFDGRIYWKHCPTVNKIWDQGACASDWAIAAASAIADRICIATNGTFQLPISPERPLSCCKTCGWGCRRGYPAEVWKYWAQKGLVTGGEHRSKKGCQPYSINPERQSVKTPRCRKRCYNRKYDKSYKTDMIKGKKIFQLWCPYCSAGELKRHGPLTANLAVFEDFLLYKTGIYHHVYGKRIGSIAVRVLGFDVDRNVSYWIAANSWGTNWGENGFFKIRRFVDECLIESSFTAGRVKLPKKY